MDLQLVGAEFLSVSLEIPSIFNKLNIMASQPTPPIVPPPEIRV